MQTTTPPTPPSRRLPRLHRSVVCVAAALTLLLLGSGCSVVSVPRPVGEKPFALVAAEWEGIWVAKNDIMIIAVTNAAAGELRATTLKGSRREPSLESGAIFVTEVDGTLFASVLNKEDNAVKFPYLWARLRRDTDQILVWFPDAERFAALVRAGKLAGKVDGTDVILEAPTAAQLAALVAGELGPVFDTDASPAVLRRVAR
ncbi:MAG: hypothetical protein RLZZ15_2557 [Verrucomicrobiota bacterium]